MLDMNHAPQKGTIYATFIDKMVLKKYVMLSEIEEYLVETGLLELHLFDSCSRPLDSCGFGRCPHRQRARTSRPCGRNANPYFGLPRRGAHRNDCGLYSPTDDS